MNLKNIDLNLLVYFDVLLRKRNVTRSAESLGISQPAMSNGLQRLRKLFNDPLLVRTKNGMSPTERAERLRRIHGRSGAPPIVTTGHIYRGIIPFVLIQVVVLGLLWMFPAVVTIVPNLIPN